ncbi:MAG: MogA/MoaB family molybdenum cofactor biosynthesis protein [Chloroflexi bacterium]|nr:MogA/MoaB family molybdenum cofactor biosynthesis protein [Chloroflexota bacterium]
MSFAVAVLTVSDKGSRGQREDTSGPLIGQTLSPLGGVVTEYAVVPDDKETIAQRLMAWADSGRVDLIATTGGTGLAPRDVTPEATLAAAERLVPGLTEVMRGESLKKTPQAMLSRAVAGIRGRTLIVNLPGSPKAVAECLSAILPALPHAIEMVRGEGEECASRDDLVPVDWGKRDG